MPFTETFDIGSTNTFLYQLVSEPIWKQIEGVVFIHKPDGPRDISASFSTFNAECYLVCAIESLVKIGFGHDILCFICQIWVSRVAHHI